MMATANWGLATLSTVSPSLTRSAAQAWSWLPTRTRVCAHPLLPGTVSHVHACLLRVALLCRCGTGGWWTSLLGRQVRIDCRAPRPVLHSSVCRHVMLRLVCDSSSAGQLGDGSSTDKSFPPLSDTLSNVVSACGGYSHTCEALAFSGVAVACCDDVVAV